MRLDKAIQLFDTALAGVVAPRTRDWYAGKLAALADHLGEDTAVDQITIHDLRGWRANLVGRQTRWSDHPTRPTENHGLSPHTVHGHIRAARRFFAWLEAEGLTDDNPAQRLEFPRLPNPAPKAITQNDLQALLEATHDNPRDQAIILFLADTGARLSGVAGLRLADLDLERKQALVWEKGRGGNGQSRVVYFGERTARAIAAYLDQRGDKGNDGDTVWMGTRGALTRWGIYHLLRRAAKRAGIKGRWNPHAFRHGWAKHALQAGADLGTVKQVLGHSDIAVTHNFYGHWAEDELADRARQFSPVADISPTDSESVGESDM